MFKEISTKDLTLNPFEKIGKEWMLITAGNEEKFNTMTASWGGLGVLWNKDVAFTFIRPSRYTFEFTQSQDYFSLCFFPEEYKDALMFCGRNSGRDCDKVKETGLTPAFIDGVPCFEKASLVLICKKLYAQEMNSSCALCKDVNTHYGENEPYHTFYVGEIVKAFTK
ncbi:MAG: flavin reductase family protein [Ruminococcaceae bacterium]|nr:flavin reductase family protein [Oscillospiraceae bacterium]